jgi:hypothetical protein
MLKQYAPGGMSIPGREGTGDESNKLIARAGCPIELEHPVCSFHRFNLRQISEESK